MTQRIALLSLSCAVMACSTNSTLGQNQNLSNSAVTTAAQSALSSATVDMCAVPAPGAARCFGKYRLNQAGNTYFTTIAPYAGYAPSDLQQAYNAPTSGGVGVTVALVDAQDAPNAEADLGTYRSYYGLPPCTTANGCFQKVNQAGQPGPLPTADSGWAGEISLDIEMVSAICPNCKILLVEANSSNTPDLGAAENMAVQLGATVVSNSWGGLEDNTIAASEPYFNHPGVSIFVAAGDAGYGAEYPATSAYVTAVGGTSLSKAAGSERGWTETAWSSGGSGCSQYVAKPSWQNDTGCTMRTVADVSAVADPMTGPAIYCTDVGGWTLVGGTSAASPIVAAMFAASGNAGVDASYPYSHTAAFNNVTSGSNGTGGEYLCTSGPGYSGPTGWGSPNGTILVNGGGVAVQPAPPAVSGTCPAVPGCDHSICQSGDALNAECNTCTDTICQIEPGCCSSSWSGVCATEAKIFCSSQC